MLVARNTKQAAYENVSASGVVLAADDFSSVVRSLVAARAGETIYVQRVEFAVTTDNAATQQIEDTAGTPIVVAKTKASPGIGPITFEFGDEGIAVTEGKGLSLRNSAAGLACAYSVMAYRRRTANVTV